MENLTPAKENVIISVDASLRSSGLICLDRSNNIIKIGNIYSDNNDLPSEYGEALLLYNTNELVSFVNLIIKKNNFKYNITHIIFEGLSFNAKSKIRDLIDANHWVMRYKIAELYPEINIGCIPVKTWRKLIIPEVKDAKKALKEKYQELYKGDWIKMICVDRLPEDVKTEFDLYLDDHRTKKHLTKKQAHKLIYDLTDSYFLAKYSNTIIE